MAKFEISTQLPNIILGDRLFLILPQPYLEIIDLLVSYAIGQILNV